MTVSVSESPAASVTVTIELTGLVRSLPALEPESDAGFAPVPVAMPVVEPGVIPVPDGPA